MPSSFELSKTSDGQFRFVLRGDDASALLTSETYTTKASAQGGIASVQANSATDGRYEKRTASNGAFYFVLKAANGQIIGNGRMYDSEAARDAGIAAVTTTGATTDVTDSTE
jgi:uncharacterized protein YegP (UPF0339 family)